MSELITTAPSTHVPAEAPRPRRSTRPSLACSCCGTIVTVAHNTLRVVCGTCTAHGRTLPPRPAAEQTELMMQGGAA